MYRVLVPEEPTEQVLKGAALLEVRGDRGLVFYSRQEGFAELCAQAARGGRLVPLPENCSEAGVYDEQDGEMRLNQRNVQLLERWVGHRISRSDLEARDNRSSRRAQARRLTMQGRTAEAFMIDRRFGL